MSLVRMRPIGVDQRLLHARRCGGVVVDLERVETFAARERFQSRGVVDELGERYERDYARAPRAAGVRAENSAADRRAVTRDVTDASKRYAHGEPRDRLEDRRRRFRDRI